MLSNDLRWLADKLKIQAEDTSVKDIEKILELRFLIETGLSQGDKFLDYVLQVYPRVELDYLEQVRSRYLQTYLKDHPGEELRLLKARTE